MLSRTAYIIAIQVHNMSVAEAEEFYGSALRDSGKTQGHYRQRARLARRRNPGFAFNPQTGRALALGEVMGPLFADEQFKQIVQFATGRCP